jgi:hypothetical protein
MLTVLFFSRGYNSSLFTFPAKVVHSISVYFTILQQRKELFIHVQSISALFNNGMHALNDTKSKRIILWRDHI